ncbi:MAG: MlaD family protein [Rhodospirillaceae bacterium]|nr:MlaD family protein [Rhodospirillaceae bacterium]
MQDSRINYVIVGGFVAAVLAAFLVVVSILAGRTGATDEYYTVYNNVNGLKFGTLVLYEGYQIGQVDSIEPMFEGQNVSFRVNLSVQEGWKIPEDSVARASVGGLLSALTIDIDGGQSPTALKPGSLIKGASASNFFAALSDIGSEFGEISSSSIKPLLASLNAYVKDLDKMTQDNVPVILGNLTKISEDLARDVPVISASLKRTSQSVETGVFKPENVARIDTIIANLDKTSANLAGISDDIGETREMLMASMRNINRVVEDNAGNVDESIRSLRYTLDTIARYIDDIAHNTEATTRNLSEFSRAIRENPGLLVSGSPQSDRPKTDSK